MRIDFRPSSGVVSEHGFKPCLGAPPAASTRTLVTDRIDAVPGAYCPPVDLEAVEGSDGHTLRRHVGRSDEDLRSRALRTHHDVSCFDSERCAQESVDEAFRANQGRIRSWLASPRRGNLALHVRFDGTIGRVFRYDLQSIERANDADVILERRSALPQGYTVITAFPT